MFSLLSFDSVAYLNELKVSGIPDEHANAIMRATTKAMDDCFSKDNYIKHTDLRLLELSIKKELQEAKLDVIKYIHQNSWKTIGVLATLQVIILGLLNIMGYAGH